MRSNKDSFILTVRMADTVQLIPKDSLIYVVKDLYAQMTDTTAYWQNQTKSSLKSSSEVSMGSSAYVVRKTYEYIVPKQTVVQVDSVFVTDSTALKSSSSALKSSVSTSLGWSSSALNIQTKTLAGKTAVTTQTFTKQVVVENKQVIVQKPIVPPAVEPPVVTVPGDTTSVVTPPVLGSVELSECDLALIYYSQGTIYCKGYSGPYELYSLLGRPVMIGKLIKGQNISVPSVPKGVYLLRLEGFAKKILIP